MDGGETASVSTDSRLRTITRKDAAFPSPALDSVENGRISIFSSNVLAIGLPAAMPTFDPPTNAMPNIRAGVSHRSLHQCLLPPAGQVGLYDYINSGVYLHDVLNGADDGDSRSHRVAQQVISKHLLRATPAGSIDDLRKVGLPSPQVGPWLGRLRLVYDPRCSAFRNKRVQRFSEPFLCRRDNAGWTRFANPFIYGEREHMMPFLTQTTPRVRSVFGFPEPGHHYYTEETLSLLASTIPGMDIRPYREAMEE